jgi:signal transduction histidine kinase
MNDGTLLEPAYTRPIMDRRTIEKSPEARLEALCAEADEVLNQSTDQLRALTERLRRASEADARTGRLVARLELAVRDVEQCRLLLPGSKSSAGDGTRPDIDGLSGVTVELMARDVLEAQEEERTRIAEELHDGPAQALANAYFQVEIIDRTLRDDAGAAAAELDALRALLDRELDRLRGFIHQLRPPVLEDGGLEQALHAIAEQLVTEEGLAVEVHLDAPTSVLDGQDRIAVLRVAQEAMRNVRKHAGAKRVWLTTSYQPGPGASGGDRVMEVRDDGKGFDVSSATSMTDRHHFGLRFVREQTALIGGRLEIMSEPGQGSVVRLVLDPGERSQRR